MKLNEICKFVHQNIEQYAGRKATLSGTVMGGKFSLSGMLSSCWQQSIPVCTVRGLDANGGNLCIDFKKIKNITELLNRNFDSLAYPDLGIESPEVREYHKHTGRDRIAFEIELKGGDKIELWINRSAEYANVKNIIAKVEGTYMEA